MGVGKREDIAAALSLSSVPWRPRRLMVANRFTMMREHCALVTKKASGVLSGQWFTKGLPAGQKSQHCFGWPTVDQWLINSQL